MFNWLLHLFSRSRVVRTIEPEVTTGFYYGPRITRNFDTEKTADAYTTLPPLPEPFGAVVPEYLEHTDAGDECDYGQKCPPKPVCDEYREMIDRMVAAYREMRVIGARDDLTPEEKERLLEPIRCFQLEVEEEYRVGRE